MRNCANCIFFKTKFKVSTVELCCSELGISSYDLVCADYKVKEGKDVAVEESIVNLTKDIKDSLKADFFNIVAGAFHAEQDIFHVIKDIEDAIAARGYEIPFDKSKLVMYASKLIELRVLYQSCLLMGLGTFVEKIVTMEIENLFGDPRRFNVTKPFASGIVEK